MLLQEDCDNISQCSYQNGASGPEEDEDVESLAGGPFFNRPKAESEHSSDMVGEFPLPTTQAKFCVYRGVLGL